MSYFFVCLVGCCVQQVTNGEEKRKYSSVSTEIPIAFIFIFKIHRPNNVLIIITYIEQFFSYHLEISTYNEGFFVGFPNEEYFIYLI